METFLLYQMDQGSFVNWLRRQKLRCDSVLKTEDGEEFYIHTAVVSPASDYFRALYFSKVTTQYDGHRIVDVPGIRSEILEKVLQFIYCKKISVASEEVGELLLGADYLRVESLIQFCSEFIADTVSCKNCMQYFKVALELHHLNLVPMLERYLLLYFVEVARDPALADLPYEVIYRLLKKNSLNSSEDVVWDAVVTWVQHKPEDRMRYVPSLLSCLRVDLLQETYIYVNVLSHPVVADNPFCEGIKRPPPLVSCKASLMSALQNGADGTLSFGTRAPDEIVFLVRDSQMRGRDEEGCWIYEMFDYEFDMYRLAGRRDGFYPSRNCVIGEKIYLFDCLENEIVLFDVVDKIWELLPPLNTERFEYEIVSLSGRLYAIGGCLFEPQLTLSSAVEVYNEGTRQWIPVKSMAKSHRGPVASDSRYIYVAGDREQELSYDMEIEKYDPLTDTWSFIPKPNVIRRDFTLVVYRDQLYIIGGYFFTREVPAVERYDPRSNRWTRLQDMPYCFYVPRTVIIDDVLIVTDAYSLETRYVDQKSALFFDATIEIWKPLELLDAPWVQMLYVCTNFQQHQVCIIKDKNVISRLRQERWIVDEANTVGRNKKDSIRTGAFG